jgi:hypothetical protein
VVLLFIAFAWKGIQPENWQPFIPPNAGPREAFGFTGIVAGAGVVFFAYIGFDAVSTAAQEAKNPQRDMPIGIITSLLVCTVLYIIVSAIATGVVPYSQLDVPDPIARVADAAGMGWMTRLIELGAIAGLSSVILVQLLGQARVFWSMSNDGLLPPIVNRIHPKYRTPWITQIFLGVPGGDTSRVPDRARRGVAGVDWNAARFRHRVQRGPRASPAGANPPPSVQDAPGLVRGAGGNPLLSLPDVLPPAAHVGAADHLAGDRPRGLFRVRPVALEACCKGLTHRRHCLTNRGEIAEAPLMRRFVFLPSSGRTSMRRRVTALSQPRLSPSPRHGAW